MTYPNILNPKTWDIPEKRRETFERLSDIQKCQEIARYREEGRSWSTIITWFCISENTARKYHQLGKEKKNEIPTDELKRAREDSEKVRIARDHIVRAMREQNKTFKEIGLSIGVSSQRARMLYVRASASRLR